MSTQADKLLYSLSPDAQVLQSSAWGKFQESIGAKVVTATGDGWHYLAIVRSRRYGNYLELQYGPTASSPKAFELAIASLRTLAAQEKALFVRTEPICPMTTADLKRVGARPAEKDFEPRHTIVIDLTQSEEELRLGLNKGRKSAVSRAAKHGLTYRTSYDPADMSYFLTMLHDTYARTHIKAHPDSHYKKLLETLGQTQEAALYLAEFRDQPVAAVVGLDSLTTRYYLYAASLPEARDLEATSGLAWFLLLDAKQKGLKSFDFFGVAPADEPNHPWAGFSHFKRSFGGKVVERLGTWEIPVKKTTYHALRAAKAIRRKLPH